MLEHPDRATSCNRPAAFVACQRPHMPTTMPTAVTPSTTPPMSTSRLSGREGTSTHLGTQGAGALPIRTLSINSLVVTGGRNFRKVATDSAARAEATLSRWSAKA